MKASGAQRGMTARGLLRATGLSGQAMRAVPFADILESSGIGGIPEVPGAYLIVTATDGRVIGIGSTGSGEKRTGTLAERLGAFIAGALGFPVKHSSGRRFWDMRANHGLSVRDVAAVCLPADDPRGMECQLFQTYEDATGRFPMLCRPDLPVAEGPEKVRQCGDERQRSGRKGSEGYQACQNHSP